MLSRFADRPIDFQVEDAGRFSQPNVLSERRSAEGPSAANRPENESLRLSLVLHGHFDAGSDCRAVCLHTVEVKTDPVVTVAGIFEETKGVAVADHGPADFREQIFVSVIVNVGKGDAVSFMELAGARGRRHVREELTFFVVQQDVGQHGSIAGIAGAEINIEITVVVDVAEVRAHGHEDAIETDFRGDIAKRAVAKIFVELERLRVRGEAEIGTHGFVDRNVVAGHKQVGPTVIVVIEKPGGEALPRFLHSGLKRNIGKGSVVIVVIKRIVAVEIGDVEINIAVVIVIARNHAFGEGDAIDPGGMRDVFEGAVALVAIEMAGSILVAHEKIEIAVVINVGPNAGLRLQGQVKPAGCGHVGESAVAIVAQQRRTLGKFPGATQDEDVETSVIVVIGLDKVQTAKLVGEAGLRSVIGESSVAVVMEIMHGGALAEIGGDNVEQAIASKVVDDEAARHGVQVDAGGGGDVNETADILGG